MVNISDIDSESSDSDTITYSDCSGLEKFNDVDISYFNIPRKITELSETSGLYGERVVKSLLEELSGQGYHLYIYRFFMSLTLADEPFRLQTNSHGTVMRRRKRMPENFSARKMKAGEIMVLQKNNINLTAFKDRWEVLIISTMHDVKMCETGKNDRATELEIFEPSRRIRRKHIFGDGSKDVHASYEDDLRRTMFSSIDRETAEIRGRFQQLQNLTQKHAFLRHEVILSMVELNLDQAP
ncbi:uncharacterized protein TNCV_2911991 [Trichonephila clavipes]|nr:uncharacterized protein TNCV_2911991 [Trichonephila clavipes]